MKVARLARELPVALALVLAAGMAVAQAPASARQASPLVEAAADIGRLIEAGQAEAAAAAARGLARMVADRAGFGVTNVRLTQSPATGFGVYEPRAGNVYATDEPVYVYVELYGFSLTPQGDGTNALVFDVAFTLDTPDGRQITDDLVPMGEIRLTSYSRPLDAYFHLTYSITGAVGAYDLRTRVIDRASGQSADFVLPLEFVAEAPAATPEADGNKRR